LHNASNRSAAIENSPDSDAEGNGADGPVQTRPEAC
jgi:hypothetical protein